MFNLSDSEITWTGRQLQLNGGSCLFNLSDSEIIWTGRVGPTAIERKELFVTFLYLQDGLVAIEDSEEDFTAYRVADISVQLGSDLPYLQ